MGRLFGLGRLMEPWARAHGKRPWSSLAETSVRAHTPVGKRAQTGGKASVIGLRREDKNKWERRAPLAPRHVDELVKQGLKVVVQPCTRRVFTDVEYLEAGAEIKEDLSECSTILAVKEVPPELLLPGRTWCFFSHTIKAQPSGMPLLDAALQKKVRLLDYECITGTGARGGPRLVAFGAFAGYAGAIDFLRGLGERFLSLGYSTPLLHIGSAFMYPTLEEAKRAVSLAGEAIRKHGLPKALCPFTAVFTGTGNVSQGALEIFKLLPHELVSPSTLPQLCEKADSGLMQREDCHKLYLSIATAEHMVKRRDGGAFDKEGYYSQPENYQPTFQDAVLPYATVILNGMYWDARFPKLFTRDDLHRHVEGGRDKLLGVCDITCDADGSVPTRQFASIEQPFHILNAMTGQLSDCLDDPGVLFHAVDHLPSELPRESSEHFGDCLVPFLPYLAEELAPMEPGSTDQLAGSAKMPMPIRGAIIAEGGALTREYRYIQQLRDVRQGKVVAAEDESAAELPAAPSCCTLELTGHLFDSRLINKVADLCEQGRARMHILLLDVGRSVRDESFLSVMVMAHSDKILEAVTHKIQAAAAEASVNFRRAGRSGTTESPTKVEKKVLLLGAGHVASPFVERLLRRPNVALVVASYLKSDFDPLSQIPGASTRLQPEVLDVAAANAGDAAAQSKLDALVAGSDLVVSLLPATLHVGVARLAIRHGVSMVTASYVSPEMKALNDEAEQAGVLILNEVGLDPGIDHLSAMSMIDTARSVGSEIIRFASLCGGLPAPEVAGTNPIGYKFSWSPRGVLVASQNAARWKEDGKLREVAGVDLLAQAKPIIINNSFALDVLPNRDSTLFAELYGLEDIPTFFRGTLRFRGFCERMLVLSRLGLLRLGPVAGLQSFQGTRRRWLAEVLSEVGPAAKEDPSQLYHSVRKQLELAGLHDETGLEFLSWLGLLQDMPLPQAAADCPLDVVAQLLQRPETAYQSGERDMAIMRHELDVRRSDGAQERLVSTLIQYGEPNGHTAMAKTVGLTTAISAELVLDRPKDFGVGVSITGTAVLGVSAQMKTFGWILTPVTLVLGMLLTSEMVHLVGVTSEALELRTGEEIQSYQDFAEASLGRPGWWLSAISSTLSLFGMIFGGLILESGNMQITSPITWHWPLGGDPNDGGRKWWAVLLTSTTLFYSYVDIGHLLHNSAWIGVGLTLFCLVCVYAGTFAQFKNLDDFNSDCATTWNQPYRSVGVNVGGEEPAFESFLSLFSVFSYVMYAFAIVVTLPTLRSTMQDRSQLTPMCIIAFTVVSMEFLVIMFAYYWVFGNLGPENIIDGMRIGRDEIMPGWWATVDPWGVGNPSWLGQALGWGITLHLLCSDAIYVPVTVVSVEALLPKHVAAKRRVRFAVRLFVSLLRLLVAALIKDFVKMTNLTSAACVTMNNLILPIFAFHIAGPAVNAGPVRRVAHIFILALGAFSMVFGTIGAIHDLWASRGAPTTGSFPRPGISTQCFDAYCQLHTSVGECAG